MTERQTAETRFRELLESAPDAVVLISAQGQISLVNRRTEELFGYEQGELIDREVELLVPDRFRAAHQAHRAGYVADPRRREMGAELELYGRRRDGSEFPVEISLSPMRADGDELVIAVVRDVSERREAKLERVQLALQQAALRRVATLVARGVPAQELFAAVTEEVGRLLHVEHAHLARYEPDDTVTVVADSSSAGNPFPVSGRWTLGGENLSSQVAQTGRPARIDSYPSASGPLAAATAERGIRSGVGAPIIVAGRIWGVMIAGSTKEQPLPAGTEVDLASFTDLVATAVANAEASDELRRMADEQAALRRVATLVARGEPPSAVFQAVAEEAGRVVPAADVALVGRYAPEPAVEFVAAWTKVGDVRSLGDRVSLGGRNVATLVFEANEAARTDYLAEDTSPATTMARNWSRSSAGAPIRVEGQLWGVVIVGSLHPDGLEPGTESQLAAFTELVATAIANAQAREELHQVANEQAALTRVATLVARAASPTDLFAAVAEEVGLLLMTDRTYVARYNEDATVTAIAAWSSTGENVPGGQRSAREGTVSGLVRETGRPARFDSYDDAVEPEAREVGVRSAVGAPITVEGRLWGLAVAASTSEVPPPPGTEARLNKFTELVATAIANAESRAELMESRARIVAAADEERGRVVRDLHDGAQQRLVHAVITLKLAKRALTKSDPDAVTLLDDALQQAEEANLELRELAHGILPSALRRSGLRAGIEAIVSRMPLPVSVDVTDERFPADVESTAYFIVSEALTNVAKHANANSAVVTAGVERGVLRVEVLDDGVGGLRRTGISGLSGLEDRVSALEGSFIVESPPGQGTRVRALLPLPDRD